jgi:ferritin-like metal-binding protein YciE
MSATTLDDLFLDMLKDIYYAEKKILKALTKLAKHASNAKLIKAFEKHHKETEGQVDRLERVFKEIGKEPMGKKCEAIEGLNAEADELIEEVEDPAVLDAGRRPCRRTL